MNDALRIVGDVADMSELEEQEQRVRDVIEHFTEDFYLLGQALKPIRDQKLYRQAGFNSWGAYCKSDRIGMTHDHMSRVIRASDVRHLLPELQATDSAAMWTEWLVRPLLRMKDNNGIRRVAKKVATQVKKGKPLTNRLVTEIVETDKHGPKHKEVKKKKAEEKRKYTVLEQLKAADTPADACKIVADFIEEIHTSFSETDEYFWEDADAESPGIVKRLTQVLHEFASFMKE